MTEPRSWQSETARLGNADASDPTGWFERLWASAKDGDVTMPWDRDDPHPAPWPLTRPEIEAFGKDGLSPVLIEELKVPGAPGRARVWRAEFRRP
ncbi:hypothetical protein [Promicromonospora sp. NPDC023805]|uniref:hypothetical protein n=1 Tax=Promicromonospora sp. NPDC023805 TaxID=3154696 RepID=UPI0033D78C46